MTKISITYDKDGEDKVFSQLQSAILDFVAIKHHPIVHLFISVGTKKVFMDYIRMNVTGATIKNERLGIILFPNNIVVKIIVLRNSRFEEVTIL